MKSLPHVRDVGTRLEDDRFASNVKGLVRWLDPFKHNHVSQCNILWQREEERLNLL